jgi:hypothetical protein
VNLFDFDQRLQAVPRDMLAAFRPRLLHVLTLEDEERGRAIGALYPEDPMTVTAEWLIDLEAEPAVWAWVVAELRRITG